jgi:hypothetical protein
MTRSAACRCLIFVRCAVYSELRLCVDVLGVVCAVWGLSLFAGTKRETLWDRDNIVGLLLIGIALSTHGGLDTILRSSSHATLSGYVLGWSRSSGKVASASGWIWLYDLGYPIGKDLGDAPAGRAVYIPANRSVPDAAWNTDEVWLLRTTYRTRDLQAVRIEGEPVPLAKASGMRTWTWQSSDPLLRPAVEAAIGIALMLAAAIGLLTIRVRLMHRRSTSPIVG